jgi:hypothetical protein
MLARRGRAAGVRRPWPAGREASKHGGGPLSAWDTRAAEAYGHRASPPAAAAAASHAEYSERGNAPSRGQDGTAVCSPPRTRLPVPGGSEHQKPPARRGRANTARVDQPHRVRDLSRCLEAALWRDGGHDLTKDAARGVDQLRAEAYEGTRQANSAAVAQRLQAQRSRAKLVRRCSMPKDNGPKRPRGIPARDDPLGPRACAQRLTAISAQDVLECRDGYRPGRGALEAGRALTCDRPYGTDG